MNYTTVENPQWNIDGSAINCTVAFIGVGKVPFSATPNDSEAHGREIFARCMAGDFGPIADYVPAPDEGPQEPSDPPPGQHIPITNTGEVL